MTIMQLDRSKKIIGVVILMGVLIVLVKYLYNLSTVEKGIARVEITDCSSIEPTFLSVQDGKPVYLINRDSKEHAVKIAGNELRVSARGEKILGAEFIYGVGTYAYDCDGVENAGQIQVSALEQDLKGTEQNFKEMYDSLPKELQECVKKLLSDEFEKVYNGKEGFVLGANDQEAINSCLE